MTRITITIFGVLMLSFCSMAQQIRHDDNLEKYHMESFDSYLSKSGKIYKKGDTLVLGVPFGQMADFTFVQMGDGLLMPLSKLPGLYAGSNTIIKQIKVLGTNRIGYSVVLKTKGIVALINYSILLEAALKNGEIISDVLTSEDAMKKLKFAKDKLDMGIITDEEFQIEKSKLLIYIK